MKIKYSLLDRMCELTNKELDFLLYIIRLQDQSGHISVYYHEVCDSCGMCQQSFYSVLRSFQSKEIIKYENVDRIFHITVLNDGFLHNELEGCLYLKEDVLYSEQFKKLRAGEKTLFLYLMKATENNPVYQIETEFFYSKYLQKLNVTKKVLRSYLHTMQRFFYIKIKKKKYQINRINLEDYERGKDAITTLEYYREKSGLTQQEIADIAGITLLKYKKYELAVEHLDEEKYGVVVKIANAVGTVPGSLVKDGITQFL